MLLTARAPDPEMQTMSSGHTRVLHLRLIPASRMRCAPCTAQQPSRPCFTPPADPCKAQWIVPSLSHIAAQKLQQELPIQWDNHCCMQWTVPKETQGYSMFLRLTCQCNENVLEINHLSLLKQQSLKFMEAEAHLAVLLCRTRFFFGVFFFVF